MAQASALIGTLKRQLKVKRKTYVDVAIALGLSEASVKRLFSEGSFSLDRIDLICAILEMDFEDLVGLMAADQPQLVQLTTEQETEIANDFVLLMIALSVLNGYTFDDLVTNFNLSKPICIKHLVKLDRLQIIELLPNNKVKLRVSPNFSWIPGGPIQTFFHELVLKDFFQSDFSAASENLIVLNGLLSNASNAEVQNKMRRLTREFNELMEADKSLPMDQKFGTTMVAALRHWNFDNFKGYMKS
jgi:DNA-binding Xre family transcriptional regulator